MVCCNDLFDLFFHSLGFFDLAEEVTIECRMRSEKQGSPAIVPREVFLHPVCWSYVVPMCPLQTLSFAPTCPKCWIYAMPPNVVENGTDDFQELRKSGKGTWMCIPLRKVDNMHTIPHT